MSKKVIIGAKLCGSYSLAPAPILSTKLRIMPIPGAVCTHLNSCARTLANLMGKPNHTIALKCLD